MFTLTNTANSILEIGLRALTPDDFGYRFQDLVVAVLKGIDTLPELYDNRGAGQPDCYSVPAGVGFEIKARRPSTIELDTNSWKSLSGFKHPRLVAMVTDEPPYPIWIVNLEGTTGGQVVLNEESPVDTSLESRLSCGLSELVEALGFERLCSSTRADSSRAIAEIARKLRVK